MAAFATMTQSQVELYRPVHPSPVGVTLHRPLVTTIERRALEEQIRREDEVADAAAKREATGSILL